MSAGSDLRQMWRMAPLRDSPLWNCLMIDLLSEEQMECCWDYSEGLWGCRYLMCSQGCSSSPKYLDGQDTWRPSENRRGGYASRGPSEDPPTLRHCPRPTESLTTRDRFCGVTWSTRQSLNRTLPKSVVTWCGNFAHHLGNICECLQTFLVGIAEVGGKLPLVSSV